MKGGLLRTRLNFNHDISLLRINLKKAGFDFFIKRFKMKILCHAHDLLFPSPELNDLTNRIYDPHFLYSILIKDDLPFGWDIPGEGPALSHFNAKRFN